MDLIIISVILYSILSYVSMVIIMGWWGHKKPRADKGDMVMFTAISPIVLPFIIVGWSCISLYRISLRYFDSLEEKQKIKDEEYNKNNAKNFY